MVKIVLKYLSQDAHSDLLSSGSVDNDFRGFTVFVGSTGNFPLMNDKGIIIR